METTVLQEVIAWLFLLPGAAFCAIGAFGLLRLPDTYTRMHGAGVTDTLGTALVLIGLMFLAGHWTITVKLIGILFFLYVTSSTATHALSHAAYTSGQEPLVTDDAEAGFVVAALMYVFQYIEGLMMMPLHIQQAIRLREISARLGANAELAVDERDGQQ